VRKLNLEGASLSAKQRVDIEKKIQDDKARLNTLLSEHKAAMAKDREEKYGSPAPAATLAAAKSAPAKPAYPPIQPYVAPPSIVGGGPVELTLSNIGKKLQATDQLLKVLKVSVLCLFSQVLTS
jgi:hypothetical protein